jgi:hypothetical protein
VSAPPEAPPNVVELACRAFYDAAGVHWDTIAPADQGQAVRCMAAALVAVGEWVRDRQVAASPSKTEGDEQ